MPYLTTSLILVPLPGFDRLPNVLGDNNTLVIVLSVVFGILGFFLILLIIYFCVKKKNAKNGSVSVRAT